MANNSTTDTNTDNMALYDERVMPVDSVGNPWSGSYVYNSGKSGITRQNSRISDTWDEVI